jgi:hypothetical protein
MAFPSQHRTKLHSTNPPDRLNKEVKRRTDLKVIADPRFERREPTSGTWPSLDRIAAGQVLLFGLGERFGDGFGPGSRGTGEVLSAVRALQ